MSPFYKHLLVISDGEALENSLHLTERDRAERVLQLIKDDAIGDGELSAQLDDLLQEADEDAAQADYPEGICAPSALNPEDYLDALGEFLSARDIDLMLDEMTVPGASMAETVGSK